MQNEKQYVCFKTGYTVKIIISHLLFFIIFTAGVKAGVNRKFHSARLESISTQLHERYQIDCMTLQIHSIENNMLTVVRNPFQEICHIGFQLFPTILIEQNPSPAYRFIERYLLELFLLKDDALIRRQLYEDKVVIRFKNEQRTNLYASLLEILPQLKDNTSLSITTDNSHYSVLWSKKDHPLLHLRFPIQYELLWGMNKKEIEAHLYPDLLLYASTGTKPKESFPIVSSENLQSIGDNRFVWNGEWYAIGNVNTNQYYERLSDSGYSLIYSPDKPEESIRNLFVLPCDRSITAGVNQKLYGGKNIYFEIPLVQLLNFCQLEGCEIFVGIEECGNKKIKGMLILLNRSSGYNHVMHFNTDLRILEHPEKYKMNIQLYAYVPTHNIYSLFSEKINNY